MLSTLTLLPGSPKERKARMISSTMARAEAAVHAAPDSEQLAHGLTQKYLHGPLAALNHSDGADRKQLLALLPRLFTSRASRSDH